MAASEAAPRMAPGGELLQWEQLPPIPDVHGFAGSLAGVHDDVLLVAGGANFPDRMPWEDGDKVWHDAVFALRRDGASWRRVGALPRPLGYGVSLSTRWGIACLGGSDAQRHYAECFLMKSRDEGVAFEPLPALPRPCANACGAILDDVLYLAGGVESPDAAAALRTFWSLDLTKPEEGWRELEPFPGEGRMLATIGAQAGALYLFGGCALAPGDEGQPVRKWLRDAYRYRPGRGWTKCADLPRPMAAAPSPAPAVGQSHLLVLGGDDGTQSNAAAADHQGFPREILAYHTITDTWAPIGRLPFGLVTTPAVRWNDRIIIPGGEQRPGVRSTEVWYGRLTRREAAFGWLNYTVLFGYLAGMVLIGWACAGRNKNTDDYFKAGGRIPWWAAGLSIYATMLSSLTFMAIPAKSYATDWTFFWANVPILFLAPVIVRLYLPFFRRLGVTSAYEYLERRFHLAVRLYASAAFILFQIGRQAIVLLLPSMAVAAATDLDVTVCIVLMGVLCIAYTVMGGMEAVVWTDVAQTVVLLGAALLSLALIILNTEGGVEGLWSTAARHDKFHMFNWTWDASTAANAFWVILLGNVFTTLVPYTSDQAVVQRYLTTKDKKTAAQAIWTNALLAIPSTLIFFAIGTALFAYYSRRPELLDPLQPTDAVFPLYIVQSMPAGVAGLVIAGIFAAAQSTVSGSLNSVVTAVMTDFFGRLGRRGASAQSSGDERRLLRLARWWTAIIGLFATVAALALAKLNLVSLWDAYFNLVGLTGSGLAALFALGIFTRRTTAAGALVGAAASAGVLYYVQQSTGLHFFLYSLIGFWTCFLVGWAASWVLPRPQQALAGLTIYT